MNEEIIDNIDVFSNNLKVEFSDNEEKHKKAIISIPLITSGVNKKFIHWTSDVLNKIAEKFRGVVFKYDIDGTQGSSHVPEHLYSPYYDVGWTYDDIKGAYFDGTQLWIKGEVTNPKVIEKLSRIGANGKRELNAASSGVLLDYNYVVCTICGKLAGTCEHKRGQVYNGITAGIKPISEKAVKRALHVALTNDPADGEANIKEVLLQELRELDIKNTKIGETKMTEEEKTVEKKPIEDIEKKIEKKEEKVETAEASDKKTEGKGLITCPSCGHKFKSESADMSPKDKVPAPVAVTNSIPSKGMAPKVSTSEESTNYNRSKMELQGRIENADLLEKKYTKRVIKNIENQCKRLGRSMIETADMGLSQLETVEKVLETTPSTKKETSKVKFDGQDLNGYGSPSTQVSKSVEFADMSAEEQSAAVKEISKEFGTDAGFALAMGNMKYLNKVKQMKR